MTLKEKYTKLTNYCNEKHYCRHCLLSNDDVCVQNLKKTDTDEINEAYAKVFPEECDVCGNVVEPHTSPADMNAWDLLHSMTPAEYEGFKKFINCEGLADMMENYSNHDIINKYNEFMEQLRVGDEVTWLGMNYIVIRVEKDTKTLYCPKTSHIYTLDMANLEKYKKTGRHFEMLEVFK